MDLAGILAGFLTGFLAGSPAPLRPAPPRSAPLGCQPGLRQEPARPGRRDTARPVGEPASARPVTAGGTTATSIRCGPAPSCDFLITCKHDGVGEESLARFINPLPSSIKLKQHVAQFYHAFGSNKTLAHSK